MTNTVELSNNSSIENKPELLGIKSKYICYDMKNSMVSMDIQREKYNNVPLIRVFICYYCLLSPSCTACSK